MKVVPVAVMQALDTASIERGIPSILLMEHAALGMAAVIARYVRRGASKIVIVCGTGNNGGDGLALSRIMHADGVRSSVFIVGDRGRFSADAAVNYRALPADITPVDVTDDSLPICVRELSSADIIVDALFGTGVDRPVGGTAGKVIEAMNSAHAKRISLDIPSGLPALGDGGISVHAHHTITVGLPKDIFFREPYARHVGRISIVPSVFPRDLIESAEGPEFITRKTLSSIAIPDDRFASKRSSSVSIIAGSDMYPGAAVLAASALYRIGVGYIRLFVPRAIRDEVRRRLPPDIVTEGVGEKGDDHFVPAHVPAIVKGSSRAQAVLFGCGIDRDAATGEFVKALLPALRNIVLDADALFFLSQNAGLMRELHPSAILTPHADEFSRLSGIPSDDVLKDPFSALAAFREKCPAAVVLKSPITFIASGSDRAVHARPAQGMGKAGMGDVLAGIISGLLARGLSSYDAARLGVYLHGKTFRYLLKERSADELQPSDVADAAGITFRRYRTKRK